MTTASDEVADAVRRMRHHGIEPRGDFEIAAPGPNYRLSDILCAVGSRSSTDSTSCSQRARASPHAYTERLAGVVATPSADEGDVHGWQAYVVQLDRRDEALARAARAGHRGADRHVRAAPARRIPRARLVPRGADAAYERALALPFHTRLTDAELDRVADALRPFS